MASIQSIPLQRKGLPESQLKEPSREGILPVGSEPGLLASQVSPGADEATKATPDNWLGDWLEGKSQWLKHQLQSNDNLTGAITRLVAALRPSPQQTTDLEPQLAVPQPLSAKTSQAIETFSAAQLKSDMTYRRIGAVLTGCASTLAKSPDFQSLVAQSSEPLLTTTDIDKLRPLLRSTRSSGSKTHSPPLPGLEALHTLVSDKPLDPSKYTNNQWYIDMINTITDLDTNYRQPFADAAQAYANYTKQLSNQFTAKIAACVTADSKDSNSIDVDAYTLDKDLDALINQFQSTDPHAPATDPNDPATGGDPGVIMTVTDDPAHNIDAKKIVTQWQKELNLPDNCVVSKPQGGTYYLMVDVTPLKNMKASLQDYIKKDSGLPSPGSYKMNNAQYQACKAGWDAQTSDIQSSAQQITQQYSRANSQFDNANQTLGALIGKIGDMCKGFLNI